MNMNQGAKILLEAAIKGTAIQELQDDGQWHDLSIKEAILASTNQLDNEGLISTLRMKPAKIVRYIPLTKHSVLGLTAHTPVATFPSAIRIAKGWVGSGAEAVGVYHLEIDTETMEAKTTFMEVVCQ